MIIIKIPAEGEERRRACIQMRWNLRRNVRAEYKKLGINEKYIVKIKN